jgi:hypothetical protein
MAGSTITISRHAPIEDLERLAHARFKRDGGVALLAPRHDERRCRLLRRLARRLEADQRLQVGLHQGWGYRYVTVAAAGELVTGWTDWPVD